MNKIDPKEVCFIRASLKNDYVVNGMKEGGYTHYIPYKDYNLIFRVLREIWFKLGLPQEFWYNPKVKEITQPNIVIYDPLITPDFVSYVVKNHPDKKVYLSYENRASNPVTPSPDSIREENVIKCSYDVDDCEKYHMHCIQGGFEEKYRIREKKETLYDVVYVGRDKGRGDSLLEMEKKLKAMGLRTYIHICADRRFISKHKSYYKPLLDYTEYVELMAHSRSIINIVPEGQKALTLRDLEVVFNGVKGITNSTWIKNFELYDPSRYFILGERPLEELPAFLDEEFKPVSEEELEPYTGEHWLNRLLSF